jgi:hypothetical protein
MAIKFISIFLSKASKIYPNWDFWFENLATLFLTSLSKRRWGHELQSLGPKQVQMRRRVWKMRKSFFLVSEKLRHLDRTQRIVFWRIVFIATEKKNKNNAIVGQGDNFFKWPKMYS